MFLGFLCFVVVRVHYWYYKDHTLNSQQAPHISPSQVSFEGVFGEYSGWNGLVLWQNLTSHLRNNDLNCDIPQGHCVSHLMRCPYWNHKTFPKLLLVPNSLTCVSSISGLVCHLSWQVIRVGDNMEVGDYKNLVDDKAEMNMETHKYRWSIHYWPRNMCRLVHCVVWHVDYIYIL